MLGFSYDWSRSLATTDVEYFKWTQWIFLQLFDTWFDAEQQKGRPISELPIPEEITARGEVAVANFAMGIALLISMMHWLTGVCRFGNSPCQ